MKLFAYLSLAHAVPECNDVQYNGKWLRGFYMKEQLDELGEIVDYEKCLYVAEHDLNWVEANKFCQDAIDPIPFCKTPYCKPGLASVHTHDQRQDL